MPARIRVVLAGGPPADALARYLRDAGFEVILSGGAQDAAQITAIVIQEDADAVVVMDGPHVRTEVLDRLAERGATDVLVLGDEPAGEIVERLRPDPN